MSQPRKSITDDAPCKNKHIFRFVSFCRRGASL
uniref:Uncharacterized protein n=1 Tax=Anguilla anguilla TaxID=7936 RepID=A0A0E9PBG9_ANGAN